jgi:DNA-binding transcriptional LysR family regulator
VLAVLGTAHSVRVCALPGPHGQALTQLVWRADDDTPALQALRQELKAV